MVGFKVYSDKKFEKMHFKFWKSNLKFFKKMIIFWKKVLNRSNVSWLFSDFIPSNYEKFEGTWSAWNFFPQKFNFLFSLLFGKKLLQGTKFETNHMWSNYTEGLPPKLIILSPGGSSAQERNKTGNNFQFSHNSEFSQGPQCRKPDAEPTRDIEHPVGNLVDRTSVRRNLTP